MKIKKGDQVLVIKGKDKGKKGKVLRSFPKENRVLVEGINIRKVHKKPKREGEKGQIVEVALPIYVSKVKLICPRCGQPARVGFKDFSKTKAKEKMPRSKVRVCKKCGQEI